MTGPAGRRRTWRKSAVIAAAMAAGFVVYLWVVEATGFMPRCWFKSLTGWSCPGCGSQRAFQALLHGSPWEAWSYNYFLPFGVAYVALLVLTRRDSRVNRALTRPAAIYALAAAIAAWGVVRNILNV